MLAQDPSKQGLVVSEYHTVQGKSFEFKFCHLHFKGFQVAVKKKKNGQIVR